MTAAPAAFQRARTAEANSVQLVFNQTDYLRCITPKLLIENPWMLSVLRMTTCPPIAVDRLVGLAGIEDNLVDRMTKHGDLPPRAAPGALLAPMTRICKILTQLLDYNLFPWLKRNPSVIQPCEAERANAVVTDRLSASLANPEIRNAQEVRQLDALRGWLITRRYRELPSGHAYTHETMPKGTFSFRMNIPVNKGSGTVNLAIDAVVKPRKALRRTFPFLIEAKSAGDFTNVNKRRKEEAQKASQLRETYVGRDIRFHLLLCGYFDVGYLEYEQASGITWTWEHQLDNLALQGL